MYALEMLWDRAGPGLRDLTHALAVRSSGLGPAARRDLFGPVPLPALLLVAAACLGTGLALERLRFLDSLPVTVHVPLVLFGLLTAWRTRSVLFWNPAWTERAKEKPEETFRALGSALCAGCAVMAAAATAWWWWMATPLSGPAWSRIASRGLSLFELLLRYGAALAVLTAVLTYSKAALGTLGRLFLAYLAFGLTVAVTQFLVLGLAPFSSVTAFVLDRVLDRALPESVLELFDQLAYTSLVVGIYAALVGALWSVAQASFDDLVRDGEVGLIDALEEIADEDAEEGA